MDSPAAILITGNQASGKTLLVQIIADALKNNGVAHIVNDGGDVFGYNGTKMSLIKGVVSITTLGVGKVT